MTENTFFSNEAISLEKSIVLTSTPVETKLEDLDEVYEINRCAKWIQTNNFQRVCLQFPDHLLPDSSHVVLKLQKILKQTLYLLGDTAYESCCVDYIAAAHINADAIIHFGPVCFSKTSANIPHINIYEKKPLNITKLRNDYDEAFEKSMAVVLLVDSIYLHVFDKIVTAFAKIPKLQKYENVTIQRIDEINDHLKNKDNIFFLGEKYQTLVNIALTFKPKQLNYYDGTVKIFEDASKIIKRRHFIIEKIKDSETIGIIIGTLGVKNYLQILDRIKSLIGQSGKKYYLISVGKPTVAKLANFPEMDIYVVVTCSMSEIYESRDFYKPIATPFDVEAALNLDPDKNTNFTLDYNAFLNDAKVVTCTEPTVSLLTNKLRVSKPEEHVEVNNDTSLAVKDAGTVALNNSGAGYLLQRSWQGLEQSLGQTEAHLAKEGRDGIPLHYKNEETHS